MVLQCHRSRKRDCRWAGLGSEARDLPHAAQPKRRARTRPTSPRVSFVRCSTATRRKAAPPERCACQTCHRPAGQDDAVRVLQWGDRRRTRRTGQKADAHDRAGACKCRLSPAVAQQAEQPSRLRRIELAPTRPDPPEHSEIGTYSARLVSNEAQANETASSRRLRWSQTLSGCRSPRRVRGQS
jgi:hypothetical protein